MDSGGELVFLISFFFFSFSLFLEIQKIIAVCLYHFAHYMRIYYTIKPYFNVLRSVKSIRIPHPVRTFAVHRFYDSRCSQTGLKIPTGRQTSWLFTSMTEELNWGPPRNNSSLVVRAGLEPATSGFQVRRPNHSATLPPFRYPSLL